MQNVDLTEKSRALWKIKYPYPIKNWVKKCEHLVIKKLKNVNFTALKVLFFLEDVDIENVLASNKMSSGK